MFQEQLYDDHGQALAIGTVLYDGRTAHQDVLIFTNPTFGKVFTLDGVVQFTERDNHVYHEMIAHVPLMAHGAAKRVLIIGGGDGGTLKEVLKHPIESVVLVELDREVITLSRRFFPQLSQDAFDDDRVSVIVGDGADYVRRIRDEFDVVIIDSTDPIGPGTTLFSEDFYQSCRSALRPNGIVCVQSGAPFYRPRQLDCTLKRLGDCFGSARPFLAPVPTYAHGLLALVIAGRSDRFCPPIEELQKRFGALDTSYYSPDVHQAAFVLPPSFKSLGERRDGSTAADGESFQLPEWITKPARIARGERSLAAPGT